MHGRRLIIYEQQLRVDQLLGFSYYTGDHYLDSPTQM